MREMARQYSGIRQPIGGGTQDWISGAPVCRESQDHVVGIIARGDVNTVETPAAAVDPREEMVLGTAARGGSAPAGCSTAWPIDQKGQEDGEDDRQPRVSSVQVAANAKENRMSGRKERATVVTAASAGRLSTGLRGGNA